MIRVLIGCKIALVAALLLPPGEAAAGGCGYGYSYSYPSYSSYSYSYPSYSAPYYPPTVIEKVKYVEKPVYIAQYAPLLVTVPSYSIGYSPPTPQVQTALAPPAQAPAPQAPAPAPAPAPQAPTPQPQYQAPPCEAKLQECQTRLSRMEAQLTLLAQQRTTQSPSAYQAQAPSGYQNQPPQAPQQPANPFQAPAPQQPNGYAHPGVPGLASPRPNQHLQQQNQPAAPTMPSQPMPPAAAAQVLGQKCSNCHSQQTAAQFGGKLVLVHQIGNNFMLADLKPQDWSSILDSVATGRMPRKPPSMNQTDFDRHMRLTENEVSAIMNEARRYLSQQKRS